MIALARDAHVCKYSLVRRLLLSNKTTRKTRQGLKAIVVIIIIINAATQTKHFIISCSSLSEENFSSFSY